jgi:hypothetical protein
MYKSLSIATLALLFPVVVSAAVDKRVDNEPKLVPGMSIVGNNETPKSLSFVPWGSSEVSKEVNFTSGVINEELRPVDKSDFIRELDLYRKSNPN